MQPEHDDDARIHEALNDPEDGAGDVAEEHDDLTVGDEERGGPEYRPEDESPHGYGGGDLR